MHMCKNNSINILKRKIKIYLQFVKAGMHETATYRLNFCFRIIGNSIGCFISYFLWNAVYSSGYSNNVHGFEMFNMTAYVFMTFLTSTVIYSGTTYYIGEEIRNGAIAMRLIKPIAYDVSFLFHEIGNKILTTYMLIVPFVVCVEIYRLLASGAFQFDFVSFIFYLISCILAYMINFYINICFSFIAFFTSRVWGVTMIKNTIVGFLSGAIIPISFFPDSISRILKLLPFASLNYTPVMIYLNTFSGESIYMQLGLQLIWVIMFWLLSKYLWVTSMKYLCVHGG